MTLYYRPGAPSPPLSFSLSHVAVDGAVNGQLRDSSWGILEIGLLQGCESLALRFRIEAAKNFPPDIPASLK